MFTDILPLVVLVGGAALILVVLLGAKKKRENHCGKNPVSCLWCGKDCEFYQLNKLTQESGSDNSRQ